MKYILPLILFYTISLCACFVWFKAGQVLGHPVWIAGAFSWLSLTSTSVFAAQYIKNEKKLENSQ